MKRKELFIIALSAVVFFIPVYFLSQGKILRRDTDYDSNLPLYLYVADYLRIRHVIPFVNPYAGKGLPVLGDPLQGAYNPLLAIPVFMLGPEQGIRIMIFIAIFLSGLSMWLFLGYLGIEKMPRVWGAVLYELSGALASRVYAGHSEKVLSYPLLPLAFIALTSARLSRKIKLVMAAAASLAFLSGDLYAAWFMALFFIISRVYFFFSDHVALKRIILDLSAISIYTLVLSLPKLVAYFWQTYGRFERFFPIDAQAGSIHAPLVFLSYIMPFQEVFFDRPAFQRLVGFHYNWYEYFAFISPTAFIFIVYWKKIIVDPKLKLLLVLFVAGSLYLALRYPYSPFFWLQKAIPSTQAFRVPQRVATFLLPAVVAFLSAGATIAIQQTKGRPGNIFVYLIMLLSVVWTGVVSQKISVKAFEPPRSDEKDLVHELRQLDRSAFYVVNFICCDQWFLMEEKIAVLNYYYGWRSAQTPNFVNASGQGNNYSLLRLVRPTYVIDYPNQSLEPYDYAPVLENKVGVVWKTDSPNIFPPRL